jgi:hypothetical protein
MVVRDAAVPAAGDAVALVGREQAEGGKECRALTYEDRHEGRRWP